MAQGSLTSGCLALLDLIRSHVPGGMPGIVLAVGMAIILPFVLALAQQLLRTNRQIGHVLETDEDEQPETLKRTARRIGLDGRIKLVDSDEFHSFCFGLWRPQVCLSTAVVRELPDEELEAVLRHEAWHVHRKDPLRSLLSNAFAAGFWFVPLAKELARVYKIRSELAADAGAVLAMKDVLPLAGALHRMATIPHAQPGIQPAVGAFSALDARIDYLVDGIEPSLAALRVRRAGLIISGAVLGAVALTLCLFLMSAQLSSAARACFPC